MKIITAIRAFGCDRRGNLVEEKQDFDTVEQAHDFTRGAPYQNIRMNHAISITDLGMVIYLNLDNPS